MSIACCAMPLSISRAAMPRCRRACAPKVAVVKALGLPDVRGRLEAAGFEVKGNTPQEIAEGIAKGYETYQKNTTEAGINPE